MCFSPRLASRRTASGSSQSSLAVGSVTTPPSTRVAQIGSSFSRAAIRSLPSVTVTLDQPSRPCTFVRRLDTYKEAIFVGLSRLGRRCRTGCMPKFEYTEVVADIHRAVRFVIATSAPRARSPRTPACPRGSRQTDQNSILVRDHSPYGRTKAHHEVPQTPPCTGLRGRPPRAGAPPRRALGRGPLAARDQRCLGGREPLPRSDQNMADTFETL
jgi:hypothetical protein